MSNPQAPNDGFTQEDIVLLAGEGMEYLQKKLGRETIFVGDALTEYIGFQNKDDMVYTYLFCLALTMLQQTEKSMEKEQPGVHQKLMFDLIERYN